MLCKRIIPSILVRGKTAYKGEKFNSTRSVGSALASARIHAARGVDELMILDIAATAEGRGPDLDLVLALSEGCFIPITVGGGVRTLKDIDDLLRAGADKVAICTASHEVPDLISRAANRYGNQAIVAVIEHRNWVTYRCGSRTVKITPVEWAKKLQLAGAGEIVLSNVERDGTLSGYDIEMIRAVSNAVDVPVIASGGCRDYADMEAAFKAGADGCAAGAMFQWTDQTPKGAARFLKQAGLEMRV